MSNSLTACDLPIASICPAKFALVSFCALMSLANFTTLNGLPASSRRIVGGENPDFLSSLAEPLVFGGLILAARQLRPELAIGWAVALPGAHEHAVMAALDLIEPIAHDAQEVLIGGDDRAVEIEFDYGLRTADRGNLAGILEAANLARGDVGGEL